MRKAMQDTIVADNQRYLKTMQQQTVLSQWHATRETQSRSLQKAKEDRVVKSELEIANDETKILR